jgi:Bacterial Ig-like domain
VSYDPTTRTATLTPTSLPLLASTSYTATVASTVKGSDGVAITPFTWAFTTGL